MFFCEGYNLDLELGWTKNDCWDFSNFDIDVEQQYYWEYLSAKLSMRIFWRGVSYKGRDTLLLTSIWNLMLNIYSIHVHRCHYWRTLLFLLLQERHIVVDQVSMQLPNLIGAAGITFKLVIRAQGLRGREVAETVGHARVLKHGQLSTSRYSLLSRASPGPHLCWGHKTLHPCLSPSHSSNILSRLLKCPVTNQRMNNNSPTEEIWRLPEIFHWSKLVSFPLLLFLPKTLILNCWPSLLHFVPRQWSRLCGLSKILEIHVHPEKLKSYSNTSTICSGTCCI